MRTLGLFAFCLTLFACQRAAPPVDAPAYFEISITNDTPNDLWVFASQGEKPEPPYLIHPGGTSKIQQTMIYGEPLHFSVHQTLPLGRFCSRMYRVPIVHRHIGGALIQFTIEPDFSIDAVGGLPGFPLPAPHCFEPN